VHSETLTAHRNYRRTCGGGVQVQRQNKASVGKAESQRENRKRARLEELRNRRSLLMM